MKTTKLAIADILLFEPKEFNDERGFFFESFNQAAFEGILNKKINFVQDNHSRSYKGVLRGLHYQSFPHAQGKLVRVVQGEIFDVAVDIRQDSTTFGCWVGEFLSSENKKQLWIPEGFAHGFLTISDFAEVLYKVTDYYSPKHECSINWQDKDINIKWPLLNPNIIKISDKDRNSQSLSDLLIDIT